MQSKRSYGLDFLKVLATICIVFHHFQQITDASYPNHINFWGDWFYWGNLVEFFFILSGYFMYKYIAVIRQQSMSLAAWFLRRAKRLLPLVAVSAVVYELVILLYYLLYNQSWWGTKMTIWGTVITALGVQSGWSFTNPFVNNPVWYISVLLLCYVLFYILTCIAKRLQFSPMYLYVGMVLLGCGIQTFSISAPFFNDSSSRGFYSFFFGLLLAHFIQKYGIAKRVIVCCVGIIAVLTCAFIFRPTLVEDDLTYLLTFLLYPSVIILFETAFAKKVFRHKFWGILGNISFDVYIWHNPLLPLLYVCMRFFGFTVDFSNVASMYIFALVSVAVGAVSYFLLEKPLAGFVDKQLEYFRSRRKAHATK